MYRFIVKGLDRESGKRQEVEVTAKDENAAVKEAGLKGIVVESVVVIPTQMPKPAPKPKGNHIANSLFGFANVGRYLAVTFGIIAIIGIVIAVANSQPEGGAAFGALLGSAVGLYISSLVLAGFGETIRLLQKIADKP